MSLLKSKTSDLLPQQRPETKNLNKNSQSFFATSNFWRGVKIVIGAIALVHVILIYLFQNWDTAQEPSFYANITSPQNICGNSPSHSGYIGLRGDSDRNPKRSFFW
jgi:anti-sigma-K factor RskA